MKINVQCVNFSPKGDLLDFSNKKIEKLRTFHGKIIDCELSLKLDNSNSVENKMAELKVKVPGNDLIVKKIDDSFEKAISTSVNSMIRILRKENEK